LGKNHSIKLRIHTQNVWLLFFLFAIRMLPLYHKAKWRSLSRVLGCDKTLGTLNFQNTWEMYKTLACGSLNLFYIFLVFSNVHHVLLQFNPRLRVGYILLVSMSKIPTWLVLSIWHKLNSTCDFKIVTNLICLSAHETI